MMSPAKRKVSIIAHLIHVSGNFLPPIPTSHYTTDSLKAFIGLEHARKSRQCSLVNGMVLLFYQQHFLLLIATMHVRRPEVEATKFTDG